MKRFARQLVTVMTTAVLVLNSTPLGGIASAWADDDPTQEPVTAPVAEEPDAQEGIDPDHEGPHTYADGACTQCGRPLAWDVPMVGEDREDIDIYVDNADGTSTLLDDAGLREIAIIASCYKTDDPNYRFDIGLAAASAWLPTGYDTSAAYFAPNDIYVDTMAEFTAKYETLRYTLKLNEDHEPQMFDVSGGTAEVVLLSQYDPETGTYDNLSPYGNPQFKMVFHLQPAQPGPVPEEVATVDSRGMGFTVNLYDYQTGDSAQAADEGINAISDLQFFEAADATTADSSADSNTISESAAALQGIVEPELGDDGYPALTEFDGNSLEVLFDTQDIAGAKDVYQDVNHLFQMEDGYLTYNSDHNYAYYDTNQGGGGSFAVSSFRPVLTSPGAK